jgi:transcriptional regulator with XRE-family HTH domain
MPQMTVIINPKQLKALRKKRGLTQQDVADRCRHISLKSISRYEKGETKPSLKKAQWLADALGTTVEILGSAPQDDAEPTAAVRDRGYVRVGALLGPDAVTNYRLVAHHYGVVPADLIEAAPWMFALLAQMSLADRKRRLTDAETAFDQAMARRPSHLRHANLGAWNFENACGDERASIDSRDIFGKKILETEADTDPFDPGETNPFVDFLRRKAGEIGSDEIDAEDCELELYGNQLPAWPVFRAWVDELTGDDWLARRALERGYAKLNAVPPELQCAEKRPERVAWLIDQIPADARPKLDQELAEAKKMIEELIGVRP